MLPRLIVMEKNVPTTHAACLVAWSSHGAHPRQVLTWGTSTPGPHMGHIHARSSLGHTFQGCSKAGPQAVNFSRRNKIKGNCNEDRVLKHRGGNCVLLFIFLDFSVL